MSLILLAIELGLIIMAWRRGWKWLALLPLGILFGLAILAGIIIGATGGELPNDTAGLQIGIDIVFIITMLVMVANPREKKDNKSLDK